MPQVYISRLGRTYIHGSTSLLTDELNVIHWTKNAPGIVETDCVAVNGIVDAWVQASYLPLVTGKVFYDWVHTRGMEARIAATNTLYTGVFGEGTTDALPFQTSLATTLGSGITGPQNSGLFHAFTSDESANDVGGTPTSAYKAAMANAMQQLLTAFEGSVYTWVVASFTHGTFVPVTSLTVSGKWGSVNSRKPGHGR